MPFEAQDLYGQPEPAGRLKLPAARREVVRINSMQAEVEEGENEFPMRLDSRY